MRIVIPGGSGQVGTILARHFHETGHEVTVLRRHPLVRPWNEVHWDGETAGPWVEELDGCDVCINLAGRGVNCRYTAAHRREILDSRVNSTRLLNEVIGGLARAPRVWLNASTATIYRHALDRPMDEATGEIGGPWSFSVEVAKAWEAAFFAQETPQTRKIAMRSAIILSPDSGGVFSVLLGLVRRGLGYRFGSGEQMMTWIHYVDFIHAVEFLIADEQFDGPVNIASPQPLSNFEFLRDLREAVGMELSISAPRWLLEIGAWLLRTETELLLKSRWVVPGRLLDAGFEFEFPDWPSAARDLVS